MERVKIGLAEWKLKPRRADALRFAAEMGLDFVQLDLGAPGDPNFIIKAKMLDACSRVIASTNIYVDGISVNLANMLGPPSMRRTQSGNIYRNLVKYAIESALALGATAIFFPSFKKSLIQSASNLSDAAEFFKYSADLAARYNLSVASENSLSAVDNLSLIQHVNRQNFKIVWDSMNPLRYGTSALDQAEMLHPYLLPSVHIKDGSVSDFGSLPLGAGDAIVQPCLQVLFDRLPIIRIVLENDYNPESLCSIVDDWNWLFLKNPDRISPPGPLQSKGGAASQRY